MEIKLDLPLPNAFLSEGVLTRCPKTPRKRVRREEPEERAQREEPRERSPERGARRVEAEVKIPRRSQREEKKLKRRRPERRS